MYYSGFSSMIRVCQPGTGTKSSFHIQPCVSAVTGWEIAIKVKLGKWPETAPLIPGLLGTIQAEGFSVLDLTLSQAERAGSLDLVYRDPFDRLIAAQAIELGLDVLSVDAALALLGCRTI